VTEGADANDGRHGSRHYGYVLDFGLEGGVLGLGLGSCGLGLEVCVIGLALALGVMSLLTSLVTEGADANDGRHGSRHYFEMTCSITIRLISGSLAHSQKVGLLVITLALTLISNASQ